MIQILAFLTIALSPSCGQVDPITNSAVYRGPNSNRWVAASYRDRGDSIVWSRPVPYYIHKMVVSRKGTAVRKGCDNFRTSPLTTSGVMQ